MSTERSEDVSASQVAEDITLLDGEELLKNVRPSWINWWLLLLIAGVLGLVGLAGLAGGEPGGLLFIVIAGLLVGYIKYARAKSRYLVTNQRVKKRVGLARKSTGETRIAKIRGLSTEQSLVERLVGKGSVLIDSGAASGKLGINGIANYDEVANTIREQQRLSENS